ncbi:hypothetical protein [Streptomyces sp. NBC_00272]|uniref:hypothetical protein n=1 Tax=Streptomyces sp. NBC_00272 TaxID=2975698 RepID=UPI002E2D38FA|nr:hypothetical protein [Streptomyces sp. NBC_00272]
MVSGPPRTSRYQPARPYRLSWARVRTTARFTRRVAARYTCPRALLRIRVGRGAEPGEALGQLSSQATTTAAVAPGPGGADGRPRPLDLTEAAEDAVARTPARPHARTAAHGGAVLGLCLPAGPGKA